MSRTGNGVIALGFTSLSPHLRLYGRHALRLERVPAGMVTARPTLYVSNLDA
jgi:hypothetical protein